MLSAPGEKEHVVDMVHLLQMVTKAGYCERDQKKIEFLRLF